MNIYVANLASAITDADLHAAFASFGRVQSARIVYDSVSGRSRGFGFVEMANRDDADAAIDGLGQTELQGRRLRLSKADSESGRRDGIGSGGSDRGRGDK